MNDAGIDRVPEVNMMRVGIPLDHACFPGHFPGKPILPGVLLLERVMSLAQACLAQPLDVCSVVNVKFLASVLPGDQLDVRLTSVHAHEHRFTVHIVRPDGTDVGGTEGVLACSGQIRIEKP